MYRILTIADLHRLGYTTSDIRCARACCLVRLSREVYVIKRSCSVHHRSPVPTRDTAIPARTEAGARSAASETRSGIAAAVVHGLTVAYPVTHHVEVAGPRPGRGVLGAPGRGGPVPAHHRCRVRGTSVTTIERTLVDVARAHGLDIAVAMIDDALHRGLTTVEAIAATLAQCLGRRSRERVRLALELCDGRRESPEESIAAVRFHQFGVAGLDTHARIRRPSPLGDICVSFCHRDACLIVEVDGINAASGDDDDQERWLRDHGFRIIRLSRADLFEDEKFDLVKQHLRRHTSRLRGRPGPRPVRRRGAAPS